MGHLRLTLLLAVTALCSCTDAPTVLLSSVTPSCWDTPARIEYLNEDTVSMREMDIVLRYNSSFKKESVKVRVTAAGPEGYSCSDTLTLSIPRHFVSRPNARIVSLPYRKDVRFGTNGYYIFEIRSFEPLRGIEAVGFDIRNQ